MKKIITFYIIGLAALFCCSCSEDPDFETSYTVGSYESNLSNGTASEMPESLREEYLPYTTSMFFKQERPADTYWYLVYPGTEAWEKVWNVISFIRIPSIRLQLMSTPGLLQSFLDYPFASELYYSSDINLYRFFHWFETCNHSYFMWDMKNRKDMGKTVVQFIGCYDAQATNKRNSEHYVFESLMALVVPGKDFYNQLKDSQELSSLFSALASHIIYENGEYGLPQSMRGSSYYVHNLAILCGSIFHDELDTWVEQIESSGNPLVQDISVDRFKELFGEGWNAETYFDKMEENEDQEILKMAFAFRQ